MFKIEFDISDYRQFREELTPRRFAIACRRACVKLTPKFVAKLQKPTATWNHEVEFETEIYVRTSEDEVTLTATTEDEIYNWVDKGTPEHDEEAISGAYMIFNSGDELYQPKTMPNSLRAQELVVLGAVVKKKKVHNPGIKPREFGPAALIELEPDIYNDVFDEIAAAWRRQETYRPR